MAAKKIQKQFTLNLVAGKATPQPPVGPTLGQNGINIGTFIKEFNDKTRDLASKFGGVDMKVPCKITVYIDRTYDFEVMPPITSALLLWKAKQTAGSAEPNKKKIGTLTTQDLEEIADIKLSVMNTRRKPSIVKTLSWTCKNMGIEVN
jgi:large subunit ribosomal protein L11